MKFHIACLLQIARWSVKMNHDCNLASQIIYTGKMESCITGEYSYECYYRWHHGYSPAFWHLALITDVPHVKKTKYIHAQCYVLMCLQRKAGELLTSMEQGNEQLHACFLFSPVCGRSVPLGCERRAGRMTNGWFRTKAGFQHETMIMYIGAEGTSLLTFSLKTQIVNIFGFTGLHSPCQIFFFFFTIIL